LGENYVHGLRLERPGIFWPMVQAADDEAHAEWSFQ